MIAEVTIGSVVALGYDLGAFNVTYFNAKTNVDVPILRYLCRHLCLNSILAPSVGLINTI